MESQIFLRCLPQAEKEPHKPQELLSAVLWVQQPAGLRSRRGGSLTLTCAAPEKPALWPLDQEKILKYKCSFFIFTGRGKFRCLVMRTALCGCPCCVCGASRLCWAWHKHSLGRAAHNVTERERGLSCLSKMCWNKYIVLKGFFSYFSDEQLS